MGPHFAFLPFPAQGHLIPMLDLARMVANRGISVTIFLIPQNADTLKSFLHRAAVSGLRIRVVRLKFAAAEFGLPEGCQYFDQVPMATHAAEVYRAVAVLRGQVEDLLLQSEAAASCLIADVNFAWPPNNKLRIPRLTQIATCCFSFLHPNMLGIARHKNTEALVNCDEEEYFRIPDRFPEPFKKLMNDMYASEKEAFGTVVNSIEELEAESVDKYFRLRGKKIWCVGPVALFNKDDLDKAERGNKASIDQHHCLTWLDSHKSGSVIYVCFGSQANISTPQLIELGLGLESSNRPFIWVIKNAPEELRTWMSEGGFEERVSGRGLLIHGWAPQVLILSHPSVGGIMMQCGWNSTMEALATGLPMITWPINVDHFCIEEYILNGIKTGIRAGDEEGVVKVSRDEVAAVIERLMDGGDEGRERRERARKVREIAQGAVEEQGSSYKNITLLIQEIINQQAK